MLFVDIARYTHGLYKRPIQPFYSSMTQAKERMIRYDKRNSETFSTTQRKNNFLHEEHTGTVPVIVFYIVTNEWFYSQACLSKYIGEFNLQYQKYTNLNCNWKWNIDFKIKGTKFSYSCARNEKSYFWSKILLAHVLVFLSWTFHVNLTRQQGK